MPDDNPTFLPIAASVAIPDHAKRQAQSVRTLLDTEHSYDAGVCGFDGPTDPTEGGLRVVFDGRWSVPSVTLNGSDGEISLCGLQMIREARRALEAAEKMAERMS